MSRNLELIANLFVRLPKICETFYWHAAFCPLQIYSYMMTMQHENGWHFESGESRIWKFEFLQFSHSHLNWIFRRNIFLQLSILIANWNSHQFHKDNVELNNVVRTQLKCGDYMKLLSQKISGKSANFEALYSIHSQCHFRFLQWHRKGTQVNQCINPYKRPTGFASSFSISRS